MIEEKADRLYLLIAVWALCLGVMCLSLALRYRGMIAEADCIAARMYGENKFLRAIIASDDARPEPRVADKDD